MNDIVLTIIIPTYNRPQLLPLAVQSALAQTISNFEVIVIDDCSSQPVNLPEHPQLRVIRLAQNRGGAAARNIAVKAARGKWITFLDDDDLLLPNMAQLSLSALQQEREKACPHLLPPPVAAISGIEVIDGKGRSRQTRIPPTLPKGSHFGLEKIAPSRSFFTKQTLVIEKEVYLSVGGFDESFRSRIHSELFLRLNLVCSLIGIPQVTYQLREHDEFRVSTDPTRRQISFKRLVNKHRGIFEAHPRMFADLLFNQALMSYKIGQTKAAVQNLAWAMKLDSIHTAARLGSPLKQKLVGTQASITNTIF